MSVSRLLSKLQCYTNDTLDCYAYHQNISSHVIVRNSGGQCRPSIAALSAIGATEEAATNMNQDENKYHLNSGNRDWSLLQSRTCSALVPEVFFRILYGSSLGSALLLMPTICVRAKVLRTDFKDNFKL
jgi:hypothetical protein